MAQVLIKSNQVDTGTAVGQIPVISGTGNVTITGTPTSSSDATTKGYVDAVVGGLTWSNPLLEPDLINDSLSTPPITPVANTVYLISSAPTGAWTGLAGHAVYWDGVSAWVDILGRVVAINDRFGITIEHGSGSEGGNMVGNHNKIATVTNATPGVYTYSFYTPLNGNAVFISNSGSQHFSHSYVYIASSTSWIEFSGPSAILAGGGLYYVGNTLNIGTVSSSRIIINSGNIDLATTGIGAGTYKSLTVDVYGRATGGTNPTTLAGYGITDAAPVSSTYVTISNDATLTNERALTGTVNQITITDNGANSSVVLTIATNPVLPGTGSVTVPIGTTGQQPGLPVNGMVRYNSTTALFEFYQNGAWVNFGSGSGSVTSVGLFDGSTTPIYTISNSPVTTTGTLTFTLSSQTQNKVLASPNGSSGQPGFRALVTADLPYIPVNKAGDTMTGILQVVMANANINIVSSTTGNARYLLLENSADGSNAYVYAVGSELRLAQSDVSGSSILTFFTQNTERMRIDANGVLCVATTGPVWDEKLQANAGTTTGHVGIGIYTSSTGYTSSLLRLQTETTGTGYKLIDGRGPGGAQNFSLFGNGSIVTTGTISTGGLISARKNFVINGNFDFWQRGTSFANGADTFNADKWLTHLDGSVTETVTQQVFTPGQTTVPNNPKYFLRIAQTAGTGHTRLVYKIEAPDAFSGRTFTLSFWAKSPTPGNLNNIYLVQDDFVSGARTDTNISATVTLTTSWQKFTFTGTFPATTGKTLGPQTYAGIDFYLIDNTVETVDFAQVQLEEGTVATSFENLPLEQVLDLCGGVDPNSGVLYQPLVLSTDKFPTRSYVNPFRKNFIINGAMDVAQRNTGFVALTTLSYQTVDRFAVFMNSGAGFSGQTQDAPTGFKNSLKILRNSGSSSTNALGLEMALETVDSIRLQGQTVTLSFWAKAGANFSAASSQLNVDIYTGTGTDQALSSMGGWTGVVHALSALQTITTSWARYSFTCTLASNITQIGLDTYEQPTGTAGAADSFWITGIQLEVGNLATSFEFRPFAQELKLCGNVTILKGVFSESIASTTTTDFPTRLYLSVDTDGTLAGNSDTAIASQKATKTYVDAQASATLTLTNKRITPRIESGGSNATPTPNSDTDDMYVLTAQSTTAAFAAPAGTPTQGQKLIIRIKDNGTAQTISWNGIYRAIGVTLPLTTVLGKTLYIGCIYNSTDTTWDVVATAQQA